MSFLNELGNSIRQAPSSLIILVAAQLYRGLVLWSNANKIRILPVDMHRCSDDARTEPTQVNTNVTKKENFFFCKSSTNLLASRDISLFAERRLMIALVSECLQAAEREMIL
jgi:hypothetical protein